MRRRHGEKVYTLTRGEPVGTPCSHGERTRNGCVERQASAEVIVLDCLRYQGRTEPVMESSALAYISFDETENRVPQSTEEVMNVLGTLMRVEK